MLIIQGQNKNYGINVPTTENEITAEFLSKVTERVKLNKYQVVIALVMKTKVWDFCMSIRNPKKDQNVAITAKLAKFISPNADDKEGELPIKDMNVGDIVVIDRSSVERGIHLSIPTIISPAGLGKYLEDDKDLLTEIVTGKRPDLSNQYICLVQFKVVNLNLIAATYDNNVKVVDNFIMPAVNVLK